MKNRECDGEALEIEPEVDLKVVIDEKKNYILNEISSKKSKGHIWTLSPIILWLLAFLTVPLMIVIALGFFTRGMYGGIEFKLTLSNYIRMINPIYIDILLKSLGLSLLSTVLCLGFGYPFAYFLTKAPRKYRTALFLLIIIPFWTNSLVRTYAWITLLRTGGLINSYLLKLHIISAPLTLLYTDGAILLGLVYTLFPFMVLPLYSSIESIDKGYIEAANDLGANKWRAFCKITIPLSIPGIVAGCILVFIPTLGYFFIPDLMGGGRTMYISNIIKNQFLTARNWPFGSATSIVVIALTIALIGFYLKITKGKTLGEVV